MKLHSAIALLVLASAGLAACDKPTVVNTPPATVVVPGPPGPAGAQGEQGKTGNTSVVVVPVPAPAASDAK